MKRTFIYPAVAVLVAAILFSSCKPSRVWATKKKDKDKDKREYAEAPPPPVYSRPAPVAAPPPQRYYNNVPLIIAPTPGFVMKQTNDGRYFHRTGNGYLYWKGYDNRFYLDNYHLSRVSYSRYEYDEWKRFRRDSQ
jgi:hypothetical protein